MCARFLTEKKEGSLRGKYGDISIKGSSNRAILPEPKSYYLHACSELLYVWVGWCSGRALAFNTNLFPVDYENRNSN